MKRAERTNFCMDEKEKTKGKKVQSDDVTRHFLLCKIKFEKIKKI